MTTDAVNYSAYRFLIVDDKLFLRHMIQKMLSRCEPRGIEHAMHGAEAIEVLTRARGDIDCVLCDWNMEPMDGLEVLRSIRAGNVFHTPRDLRFIMLTGHADEHVVKAAMELDTNGYLVKPVSMEKLIRAIDIAFAKPVALKPKETYRSMGTVDLPGTLPGTKRTPGKCVPPWLMLSEMSEKTKEAVSSRLEQFRHEGEGPLERQPKLKRLVINVGCLDLDRIVPGKVLAENIYTERGTLLLAAGLALNDSLLRRLRELATASSEPIRLTVGDYRD